MMVGILAYGSLLDEPGDALGAATTRVIAGVTTPFSIEFARSSRSRDGAPTLTVVADDGAQVSANVLVLSPSIDEIEARSLLYSRETGKEVDASHEKPSWIRSVDNFAGIELCLYAALQPNIPDLESEALARLAVRSAAGMAGRRRRDGISYLDAQLRRGLQTPLSAPYAQAVLDLVGALDLNAAWTKVRRTPERFLRIS